MKYMLMMHAPRSKGDWAVTDWDPKDLKAHIDFMLNLNKDLTRSGELVGAEGLAEPSQAKIVHVGTDGRPVTDGVFPESKEYLAGFWIVDVDKTEAARGPRRHPAAIERYRAAAARTTSVPERNYLAAQAARLAAARPHFR